MPLIALSNDDEYEKNSITESLRVAHTTLQQFIIATHFKSFPHDEEDNEIEHVAILSTN